MGDTDERSVSRCFLSVLDSCDSTLLRRRSKSETFAGFVVTDLRRDDLCEFTALPELREEPARSGEEPARPGSELFADKRESFLNLDILDLRSDGLSSSSSEIL
jgi:hypothetical protein